MNKTEFTTGMQKITDWYSRKLKDDQLDAWYHKLKFIPSEPFKDVLDNIMDADKTFPTPDRFKKEYAAWLEGNFSKFKPDQEQTDCHECDGLGYFLAYERPNDIRGFVVNGQKVDNWNRVECPCSLCENWKLAFPTKGDMKPTTFWTKDQARTVGLRLDDPYDPYNPNKIPMVRDLNKMANQVTKQL